MENKSKVRKMKENNEKTMKTNVKQGKSEENEGKQ